MERRDIGRSYNTEKRRGPSWEQAGRLDGEDKKGRAGGVHSVQRDSLPQCQGQNLRLHLLTLQPYASSLTLESL